jgi:5-methylthioribose kinase
MALPVPPGYAPLAEASLPGWLGTLPHLAGLLGGGPGDWRVREVGDGNLNLVFVVEGPRGGIVVKQALPYVRLVGEGWPLPLERSFFEHEALVEQARWAPAQVPRVHHHDPALACIVMELLTPHVIMRKGLIAGIRYPAFARDVAGFMARTLFRTSDLHVPAGEKRRRMAVFCANTELCRITEDLIFTDPYRVAPLNRWTSPQLDADAAAFRADAAAKDAVSELKRLFLTSAEALVHGDLHTGSIMVTEADTRVIDPEFAFYGPMGFDVGAVIGNLLLAYFAQAGHATAADDRVAYRAWVLDQVGEVWTRFADEFIHLWETEARGDLHPASLFEDPEGRTRLAGIRARYLDRLFAESVGFAAAKMVRRILGLAHVADLESIADPDLRARSERRALRLARDMLVNRGAYRTPAALADAAAALDREP